MRRENQVIAAKIRPPRLEVDLLARPRLIKLFENYRSQTLTVVSAPAGYGKTVLTFQFLNQIDCPSIWFQLDEHDNHPEVFLSHLLEGLARHFHDLRQILPDTSENLEPDQIRSILILLIDQLEQLVTDQLVLVFDNFHFIKNTLIINFLNQFIEYLPEKTHIILLGQSVPLIKLHQLMLRGMLTEITWQDLSFTREEIINFFSIPKNLEVSSDTINAILLRTEGWPAAIAFLKFSCSGQNQELLTNNDSQRNFPQIYEYISEEIFKPLQAKMQAFLVSTSVLENFNPAVCNVVLGINNAASILQELQERNLLIPSNLGTEKGYRYNNVFKEYLQHKLGAGKTGICQQAGHYYRSRNAEQAMEYYILADDHASARALIEAIGISMLQRGKLQTIARWLDYIHGAGSTESPWLSLIRGALLSYQGLFDEAEIWIDEASQFFESSRDRVGLFHAIIHKSRILRYRTSYNESIQYIDKIIPLLEIMPVDQWYDVIIEKSFSLWLIGDAHTAMSIAERAMNTAEKKGGVKTAWQIARYMTVLYYHTGDFTKAIDNYENFKRQYQADTSNLERHTVDSFIARIHRDRGELEKARQLMLQTLETKKVLGMIEEMSNLYYQLATLYLDLRDHNAALTYLDLSGDLFRKSGAVGSNAFFMLIQALRGRVVAETGDLFKGREMIESAVAQLQGKSDFMLIVAQFFASVIYTRMNQLDRAEESIRQALHLSEQIGMKLMISQCSGLLAGILEKKGQASIPYAKQCLHLAAREQYVQMFITFPEFLPCVKLGLEYGIEPDFIDTLLIRLGSAAIPLLLTLIRSSQPETQMHVSRLLLQIGGKQVIRELELLFYDPDANVRHYALTMLANNASLHTRTRSGNGGTPAGSNLFVRSLGEFQVYSRCDWSSPVQWRTAKAKELFAFLLHSKPHFVSKEKILDALWPDLLPENASSLLHTNLSYVRKTLKTLGIANGVFLNPGGYKLDLGPISWDASVFIEASKNNQTDSVSGDDLKLAATVYRGAYMRDWSWADTDREYYETLYSSILERLAEQCFHKGDFELTEAYLKTLLQQDPFLESAHRLLMKTYARTGNHTGITLQYNALCRLLREELDTVPNMHTEHLYHELCSLENRE